MAVSPLLFPGPVGVRSADLRVLFVSHSSKLFGAQRQLLDLVTEARHIGIEPLVGVPAPGPLESRLADLGITTVRIPAHRLVGTGLGFARRYLRAYAASTTLARPLKDWSVDLIHTNTGNVGFAALAARRAGLPHVWHHHELQHPWVRQTARGTARFVRRLIESTSRAVVVPSYALADAGSPYLPDAVRTIPNGLLRPSVRRPLCSRRKEGGEMRLLTLGREKRWTEAVDALVELRRRGRKAHWTFAGSENPARTRAYVESQGVEDAVRFVGYLDDPTPLFAEADAHVLTSSYESFGRVLVEAMAVGCPVVAHPRGGIPEIVSDGETGWLTPVDDACAMADALEHIVGDEAHTECVREAAFEDVWERFTVDRFARRFVDLYREVATVVR